MLVHWIWLSRRSSLNGEGKRKLLERFPNPEDIYFADAAALKAIEGISAKAVQSLLERDLSEAGSILERCIQSDIHILTMGDKRYPERLHEIADPPVLLYYKGRLPDFEAQPVIGIVGTRHPSAYGTQMAHRLGREIAACGGLVISGLAEGVDAAAMRGALASQKGVVGVLGCGVDRIYPRSNRELFFDTERYGCVLSEFAPGTPPMKGNFPRRNRIISGLSHGVVVVEAPERSGALITATCAAEQGREVFVVPGNVDAPGFVGNTLLLREGAMAVSSGWDVLCGYAYQYDGAVRYTELPQEQDGQTPASAAQKPVQSEKDAPSEKITIDNTSNAPYIDVNNILKGLTPDEQTVVAAIQRAQQPVDEVLNAVDMSPGKALAILTMLELKGKIIRHPGKRVSLTGKQ